MDFQEKAVVMTAADMNRVMARMASQIVENNPDLSNVLLVGIHRRGDHCHIWGRRQLYQLLSAQPQ